jgi:galactokinase
VRRHADSSPQAPEVLARAPGRVNLLGEHTDYNEGFVLPTVIPQETRVSVRRSAGTRFLFGSETLGESADFADGDPAPRGFGRYAYGCVEVLRRQGHAIDPVEARIDSDVPVGAGLSSSAALEVALLRALRELFRLEVDDVGIALLAHQAETQYAGVNCGILDQMAVSLGRPGSMLFLDTRTRDWRLLPLPPGTELLVVHSGVSRQLADSPYNRRRAECARAAELLGVSALRDVADEDAWSALPSPLDRRVRHVLSENARVLRAASDVGAEEFGRLMGQSHRSLRDDFEVSVPALDCLASLLEEAPEVFGARLTGGGFGGCCVALARAGESDAVAARVLRDYGSSGFAGIRLV